jgi:hypothetical protein
VWFCLRISLFVIVICLPAYNGVALSDSTKTTYGTVIDLYTTIASCIVSMNAGAPGSFLHPIYVDSLLQAKRTAGTITLEGLYYKYAQFASNAVTSNLITVSNNQLYDNYVNGVWQNPYQTETVFAVSPSINFYNSYGTYSLKTILPDSLWLTNSADSINSITVDFGDGNGNVTLTPNQLINITYASGGKKTWLFSLNLKSGTILQSQTDILLDSASTSTAVNRKHTTSGLCRTRINFNHFYYGFPQKPQVQFISTPLSNISKRNGGGEYGYITISYANQDQVMRKPFIVVEGFDPGYITDPEQLLGGRTLQDFLDDNNPANGGSSLLNGLLTSDYDIIYLDWGASLSQV